MKTHIDGLLLQNFDIVQLNMIRLKINKKLKLSIIKRTKRSTFSIYLSPQMMKIALKTGKSNETKIAANIICTVHTMANQSISMVHYYAPDIDVGCPVERWSVFLLDLIEST